MTVSPRLMRPDNQTNPPSIVLIFSLCSPLPFLLNTGYLKKAPRRLKPIGNVAVGSGYQVPRQ